MKTVGIDPGLDGAVALLDGDKITYWLTAKSFTRKIGKGAKRDYAIPEMARALREIKAAGDVTVFIERQGARPAQNAVATFRQAFGYGLWIGCLATVEIPYFEIHPSSWVAQMFKGSNVVGKERAVEAVGRLLPHFNVIPEGHRTPHSGLCDAICLGLWGRNFFTHSG